MGKLSIQDMFQLSREEWIDQARATARTLLVAKHDITVEDVLAECPRPMYIHRNTTGLIFKNPDFVACGFTKSRREISKGRWIMRWKLKEEALPQTMQQIRRQTTEAMA